MPISISKLALSGLVSLCVLVGLGVMGTSRALAAPVFNVESQALPTNFHSSDTSDSAQDVLVNATGGSFTLTFDGQTTHALAAGAGEAEVQSALNALSTIGGAGGSVTVTRFIADRGPENEEHEYLVTFAGTLGNQSVPLMTATSLSLSGGSHTASVSYSTNDAYEIDVENLGTSTSSGTITVEDHLPPGITTTQTPQGTTQQKAYNDDWACSEGAGQSVVTCRSNATIPPVTAFYNVAGVDAERGAAVEAIVIPVTVSPTVGKMVVNSMTVSGGGAVGVATSRNTNPANAGSEPTFGTGLLNFRVIGADGSLSTQAGAHPYAVTTDLDFTQELNPKLPGFTGAPLRFGPSNALTPYVTAATGDEARAIVAELPLGLIGDPQATPKCPTSLFGTYGTGPSGVNQNNCPPDTRVGVVFTTLLGSKGFEGPLQLFNLVPEAGHAAEFGLNVPESLPIVLYGDVVHSSRGYVLRVTALLPQADVKALSLTFFGDPSTAFAAAFSPKEADEVKGTPFLTNSVDCAASEEARELQLHIDTWTDPGIGDPFDGDLADPAWVPASVALPSAEGCGSLKFAPSLSFQPATEAEGGTTQADTPSGYNVNLEVPQNEEYSKLATPELKTATVTLPTGLSVSPSAANGLEACSDKQIELKSNEPGSCHLGSQLGTVKITTPLLEEALEGEVFLGEPECSPCSEADASDGHLFRLYIQVHSEKLGVTVKLPGIVKANPANGQLTAEFKENPELPFGDLELHFKDGPRAPLANPQTCGTFTTVSDLEPWSAPETPTAVSESPFTTTGCGSMGFAPAFAAGTASPAAGAYSNFSVSFSRGDGEQDLSGITVKSPPGLLGKIAGIQRCGEAEANAGTCSEASQIGTTTVSAGPGSNPYTVTGGRVYLTGPYKSPSTGAEGPFGLSIVVPAVAGPFNLGNVVVRAAIAVNPSTSALTITANPLPQIRDGVPFRVRTINVEINKSGFMFNATNCTEQPISSTITSAQGASSSPVSPYAPSGCANLPFKPKLTASAGGKASKADGASLHVKLESAGLGQANIAKVDLQLPKALPSRLTTLQKACSEAVFNANPAACGPESVIGKATIRTPVLNSALSGPAYLVSHGGAAFPDVEFVLQGEGVTLVLDGKTAIKKGITYSNFEATPDAPFTTFETELPAGPHSILTANVPAKANYSLCGAINTVTRLQRVALRRHGRLVRRHGHVVHVLRKVSRALAEPLLMPTTITGQNGAVIKQTTKIAVTGCKAPKPLTGAQKLAKERNACKQKYRDSKKNREACEKQVRKRYGPGSKAKRSSNGKGSK